MYIVVTNLNQVQNHMVPVYEPYNDFREYLDQLNNLALEKMSRQ